ncbi:unnamed protein product, partial [Medioppia subpectinata]
MAAILGYQLYDVSVDYFAYKTVTVFDVMDNSMDPHLPYITLVYQERNLIKYRNRRQCLRSRESPQCHRDMNEGYLFNFSHIDTSGETRISIGGNVEEKQGVDIRSLKRLLMYNFYSIHYVMVSLSLTSSRVGNDSRVTDNAQQFAVIRRWSETLASEPKLCADCCPLRTAGAVITAQTRRAVTQTMRRLLPSPYGRCSDYGSDPSTGAEGDGSGQPFRAISHFHCMRRCRLRAVKDPPNDWCGVYVVDSTLHQLDFDDHALNRECISRRAMLMFNGFASINMSLVSIKCLSYCPPDCVAMDYRSRVVNDNKDYIQKVWINIDDNSDWYSEERLVWNSSQPMYVYKD